MMSLDVAVARRPSGAPRGSERQCNGQQRQLRADRFHAGHAAPVGRREGALRVPQYRFGRASPRGQRAVDRGVLALLGDGLAGQEEGTLDRRSQRRARLDRSHARRSCTPRPRTDRPTSRARRPGASGTAAPPRRARTPRPTNRAPPGAARPRPDRPRRGRAGPPTQPVSTGACAGSALHQTGNGSRLRRGRSPGRAMPSGAHQRVSKPSTTRWAAPMCSASSAVTHPGGRGSSAPRARAGRHSLEHRERQRDHRAGRRHLRSARRRASAPRPGPDRLATPARSRPCRAGPRPAPGPIVR